METERNFLENGVLTNIQTASLQENNVLMCFVDQINTNHVVQGKFHLAVTKLVCARWAGTTYSFYQRAGPLKYEWNLLLFKSIWSSNGSQIRFRLEKDWLTWLNTAINFQWCKSVSVRQFPFAAGPMPTMDLSDLPDCICLVVPLIFKLTVLRMCWI